MTGEIVPVAPATLAKLRSLSFSFAQLNSDGSWYSKIGTAATSTSFSTSESGTGTAAVSRYTPGRPARPASTTTSSRPRS